jgi:microcystin-dependent protein
MAEPFIGQIVELGFNFAPRGYATCDGQLLSIAQNTALFSLLGTTFGGDGRVTFALPDLRGRVPIHQGQGSGLTNRTMGEMSGEENHTLITSELPAHNHSLNSVSTAGYSRVSPNNFLGGESQNKTSFYSTAASPSGSMNPQSIGVSGGNQAHNNMEPYLVVNYSIALEGIFPSRN